MRTVYKYTVPVDDQVHEIDIPGVPLITHVAAPHILAVTFWAYIDTSYPTRTHRYRIIGTGHPLADNEIVLGTTPTGGGLVWHLVEIT